MLEYKIGEFNQLGAYLLEVIKEDKKSSLVKVVGVLRYSSQGLGKDNRNNLPKFISQKPLKFGTTKQVLNQYLNEVSRDEFDNIQFEIGSEEFYRYTVHASLFIAQQTILRQIENREVHGQASDWNLENVLKVMNEHAKDFGLV